MSVDNISVPFQTGVVDGPKRVPVNRTPGDAVQPQRILTALNVPQRVPIQSKAQKLATSQPRPPNQLIQQQWPTTRVKPTTATRVQNKPTETSQQPTSSGKDCCLAVELGDKT